MDLTFDHQWRALLQELSSTYGEDLDLNSILFLVGVQELGQDVRKYGKQEKLELMHIAVCTLLEPFGYYSAQGRDNEGWPHFKKNKELPSLTSDEQERLMKEAMIAYFENDGYKGISMTVS